ncbi:MAG: type II secretion system F family protein [Candidatus Pacearchaeota archaeon]|nr:type II secretion system F family protein [Candidatus Pacearchaeota archaeon]
MELKRIHWVGLISATLGIASSTFFIGTNIFFMIIGVSLIIGTSPFVFTVIIETRSVAEKEEMFLEFARNLVESVKTGTPISKSIINVKDKPYGVLSQNIQKLANQMTLGIPLNFALKVFAKDVNNKTISRALTLIGQAEKAGGDIGEILESVAKAVNLSDKLKKERKAVISTLVVQGYIIFFVFLIIILVMQFKIIPMVSGIAETNALSGLGSSGGSAISSDEISSSFFYLIIIQGFFTGLTIGKLSEENIKAGIKHSFALMMLAFFVSAGANLFIG